MRVREKSLELMKSTEEKKWRMTSPESDRGCEKSLEDADGGGCISNATTNGGGGDTICCCIAYALEKRRLLPTLRRCIETPGPSCTIRVRLLTQPNNDDGDSEREI